MEKYRDFVIPKKETPTWHSRSTLHLAQNRIQFHESHHESNKIKLRRQRDSELIIFDIVRSFPLEKAQKLEIKHITREK